MLYQEQGGEELSEASFQNPACEYRGFPFWAWNGRLEKETLLRQMEVMKKMGFGGFFMHVRTGLDTPYLGEEFLEDVRFCVEKARREGMFAWLYDEDRWPSGSAGGNVTREHPEYASQVLMLTSQPYGAEDGGAPSRPGAGKRGRRQENGTLLAVYNVELSEDGTLKAYRRLREGEEGEVRGRKWYAYQEYGAPSPWYNGASYADTLNPEAVRAFLASTHEVYLNAVGEEFGKTIPGIFTDEPQIGAQTQLRTPWDTGDMFLPWTSDLPDTYEREYGEALLDKIPEMVWELPEGKASRFRYRFRNHVADRFVNSYCGQIGKWCEEKGFALAGHIPGEGSLQEQTSSVGEAMRCYRHFGVPGIDMLCDRHEYTTAKQAQSILHQTGRMALLSELYGVTGWDCDFRTYKLQGDWQAALGVTVRVPHLYWMTMKGEAKRDYPASIGSQSPWYDQFSLIEDHFARLNTALTRGKPLVRVAVLHPIESFWLCLGPLEQTKAARDGMEEDFQKLAGTLLFGGIDFDYLSESELPHFCAEGGNPLRVGEMEYDAVILCGCRTLRRTTVERLEAFREAGGTLLCIGEAPKYMDGEASEVPGLLYEKGQKTSLLPEALWKALEPFSLMKILREDGSRETGLLHQFRQEGECRWLFAANGHNPECKDIDGGRVLRFVLRGEWELTLYDTGSGAIVPVSAEYEMGNTVLERRWYMHDSMLLRLKPGRGEEPERASASLSERGRLSLSSRALGEPEAIRVRGLVEVCPEEPNLFLLDMAEYGLNLEELRPEEEILRIDNLVRSRLGLPRRRKEVVQPYRLAPETPKDVLHLRFRIPSEIPVSGTWLALEDGENARIRLNGVPVKKERDGWFVDPCIEKLRLPELRQGENVLELEVPVGSRTNLENFYLLGDFGVRVNGAVKTLTSPVKKLGFGDIVSQGFPFYTGNLLYRFRLTLPENFRIHVPAYRGSLLKVFLDGKEMGNIIYSPYDLSVRGIPAGEHEIAIRLYGNRYNGFGQLHHTQGYYFYQDANSFRSAGDQWSYEYQFKELGILTGPVIYTE